ncbi:3-methyl-2-oxobutanoate hydroxymethyltransferase [Candidatus Aminicenantes bacterium AC-334-K16]|nr:3-methyl-2-oxobutanoate hydroxymethyltransferase [Candidatus Aminicenantes bacterium AC-334-K16]
MTKTTQTKITIPYLWRKKEKKEKIVVLTAYDYPTAQIIDQAGVDIILVGDSLGMVVLGYPDTLPVTMEEMLHHTKAVTRAVKQALVVADMPYLSYHFSPEVGVANAARFIKEARADAVKIEGATPARLKLISFLQEAEIPVMGHVGLTPQSIRQLGEYRVQGKNISQAKRILQEALELERAGVFALVLESIPRELAQIITQKLSIPTIGIGAGPDCDGQVLVLHDMLGLTANISPKFVKKYLDGQHLFRQAIEQYVREVKDSQYPDENHSYHLNTHSSDQLIRELTTLIEEEEEN